MYQQDTCKACGNNQETLTGFCGDCDSIKCDNCPATIGLSDDKFCEKCRVETVAECSCGAHFDLKTFRSECKNKDIMDKGKYNVEQRDCSCCGEWLAIWVTKSGDYAPQAEGEYVDMVLSSFIGYDWESITEANKMAQFYAKECREKLTWF